MSKKNIIIFIIVAVVISGLSFWAGTNVNQNKKGNNQAFRQGQFGQNGNRAMMRGNNGGIISGTVISKDDKSLTIQLRSMNPNQNNTSDSTGSRIVLFSPTIQVDKNVTGTLSDVSVGNQITVIGSVNSDGSVSANSIQIRPSQVKQ